MIRLLFALALTSAAATPAAAALLALYQDRADGSTRLFDMSANAPLGVALLDCCRTVHGTLGFNPATREILLVQEGANGAQELVRISAITGAVAARVALAAGWQVGASSYDRRRALWFALARNGGQLQLVTVDPINGAVAPIGAGLPAGTRLVAGAHGLHGARGQWHVLVSLSAMPEVLRILTLDLTTGAVLASPPLAGPAHVSNLFFDEGSGYLIGLGRDSSTLAAVAVRVDPGTGAVVVTDQYPLQDASGWTASALTGTASDGIGVAHVFLADMDLRLFTAMGMASGEFMGNGPHAETWAIHGLVADQANFNGDQIFGNGFDTVNKPTNMDYWHH
jgi:hypothetical protein